MRRNIAFISLVCSVISTGFAGNTAQLYKMTELTHILIGSMVLLFMINESYQQTACYNEGGVRDDENGVYCFDTDHKCWSSLHPSRLPSTHTQFILFTCDQTTDLTACNNGKIIRWDDSTFGSFSSDSKTVVLIHGWQSDSESVYLDKLCDAFMEMSTGDKISYTYNIIMVDWSVSANTIDYIRSVKDSRLVAKKLAVLLENLHEKEGLKYADVHLVGHSLGAHLAGHTGEFLHGKLGRITGLDPAGPFFRGYMNDTDCHLDKSDAIFVDVIHSDGSAYFYGLKEPVGDEDFYPNKGAFMQPKCMFKVACSHMRALDFFMSSIKKIDTPPGEPCAFVSQPISGTGTSCNGPCPRMGINAAKGNEGSFGISISSQNCGVKFIL